ncbi:hypothetical protein ACTXT7_005127 [Hymenolepis weldensis]
MSVAGLAVRKLDSYALTVSIHLFLRRPLKAVAAIHKLSRFQRAKIIEWLTAVESGLLMSDHLIEKRRLQHS